MAMSGLVDRLRARKGFWLNGAVWMLGTEPDADCVEAADELERLEAALREIRELWGRGVAVPIGGIVRRALEGKC